MNMSEGQFPPYPSDPNSAGTAGWFAAGDTPSALKPVVALLITNLALSVLLTVVTFLFHQSVIDYQLDHRHITNPAVRQTLQHSYYVTTMTRAVVNILVSIVYAFLVRALFRGRRWAYRRVILVSALGILGLLLLQFTPYPAWMRVEQLVQALVLAGLLYCVLRPEVRAHFDPRLPGRSVRRFNR